MNEKRIINKLVYYINRLVEGDDPFPELTEDMQKWGFWDEDGFPIDEGDDE